MRTCRLLMVGIVIVLGGRIGLAQGPDPRGIEFFEKKIRPVLVDHCYSCHSAEAHSKKKLKGGLYLDSREGVFKGGDSGPSVVAGDPKRSLLIEALHHNELKMPPKGPLPKEVVADFETWVKLGAPDPRVGKVVSKKRDIDIEAGKKNWAFRPLLDAAPPTVKNAAWARTPVDFFILSTLEAKGLTPNSVTGKERLVRRAYFDFWGIPPTPVEVEAFVKDAAPDAIDRLVDRLLADNRYGEHWARHWLDIARYAESGGYEFDGDRPGAYHYRDFVIKALNADMPYDEFVRLQIAGDLIKPGEFLSAAATGFVVHGPYPGQITTKTREKIRYDHLDDMISTLGSALLGLSLGCVRCHEHKYDPIPQEDYYRLISCLKQTDSVKPKLDLTPDETRKAKESYDKIHAPIVAALDQYARGAMPGKIAAWVSSHKERRDGWLILDPVSMAGKSSFQKLDDGSILVSGKDTTNETYTFVFHTLQKDITALRLDALTHPTLPKQGPGRDADGNFNLTHITLTAAPMAARDKAAPVKLKSLQATFEAPGQPLASAIDGDKKSGWSVTTQTGKSHRAVFEADKNFGFDGGTVLTVVLKFEGKGHTIGRPRLSIHTATRSAPFEGDAELQHAREVLTLLGEKRQVTDTNRGLLIRWFRPFDPELKKFSEAVDAHAKSEPRPNLVDTFVAGNPGRDPVFFLVRGEVDRKMQQPPPGFIQVLMSSPERDEKWAPLPGKTKGPTVEPRIALAHWVTDPVHGAGHLLARVIVNRLWQHQMGRGLVATPNDFGAQGEPPTHPELLDFLAQELIKNEWRLKPIQKLIATSAVALQGPETSERCIKEDLTNKLWWRRPTRRLGAEAIRDSLLAVSGTLSPAMYGPGTLDVANPRRSIYLTVKRSQLVPFLQMFDAPEAIQSIAVRSSTTVATQALAMMNSPLVRQRAEQFAARVRPASPGETDQAIDNAYLWAFARRPSDMERGRLVAFLDAQTARYGPNPQSRSLAFVDCCQLLLCSNEFIYID